MKILFGTLVLALLACVTIHAKEFVREKGIISAHESGDDYMLTSQLINFIDKNPSSPETWLFIRDLANSAEIIGYSRVREKLQAIATRTPTTAVEKMICRRALDYLSEMEYRIRLSDRNRFIEKYKPVSRWYISSLFRKYGRGDILFSYGEDTRPRPDRAVKTAVAGTDGYMIPGKWISGESGVVYSHALIDIPDNTNIRVESDGEYVIFLNGIKAAENLRGGKYNSIRLFKCNGKGASVVTIKSFVSGSSFRISLEENNGNAISPVELPKDSSFGNSSLSEIDDYVLSEIKSRTDSNEKEFYLGLYADECGSDDVFSHYEKASTSGIDMISVMLAYSFINKGMQEDREARIVEGLSRIEELSRKKPDLVPLHALQLQKKILTVEPEKVLSFIKDTKRRGRIDYGFAMRESSFLVEYLPDAARRTIDEYLKKYPNSTALKLLKAELLLKTDNDAGRKEIEKISSEFRIDRTIELIAEDIRVNGEYSVLIDHDYAGKDDSIITVTAEAMFSCGKADEAKKILIQALSRKNNPEWLTLLGRIEVRNGRDPDLYWGKCSALYPEKTFPGDYIRFVKGDDYSQLRSMLNTADIENEIRRYRGGATYDSPIVKRGYVTRIDYNRTARFYCEELIYLRNDEDIKKYGEYRLPFNRGISIINAETYNRKGETISSSRVNEVNSCMYVSVEGAGKESLIHVAYETDSYNVLLADSALIESGTVFINDYNEPVSDAESVICVDKSLNAEIQHSNDIKPIRTSENGYIVTRIKVKNITAVEDENNSPGARSQLTWYSISSIKSHYDIVPWYRGIIQGKISEIKNSAKPLQNRVDAIHDVCNEMNKLMLSPENSIGNVRASTDVLQSGYATVHEKTISAAAMLREKGIPAYACLVAERFYASAENDATLEKFNSHLLYVPGDARETGIWVDLSDPNIPLGCVRSDLENADAIVINDNTAFMKKVYSRVPSSENIDMEIDVKGANSKYQLKSVFRGDAARIRGLFMNNDDCEKYGMAYAGLFSSDDDLSAMESSFDENNGFELRLYGEMRDVSVESGTSIYLSPFRKAGGIQEYAGSRVRQTPLLIREGNIISEKYTYILPESVSASEVSFSDSFSREGITVSYSVVKKKGELKMTAFRKTVISPVLIDVSQYGDFTEFVKKCTAVDTRRIRLVKKSE